MNNLKPAADQMQHVGAMSSSPADSLADAINRLVEQHAKEAARSLPEWLRDRDLRELYFGSCSRAQFWKYTRLPDFPKARQISPRIRVRNRFEIEKWLAQKPEVA